MEGNLVRGNAGRPRVQSLPVAECLPLILLPYYRPIPDYYSIVAAGEVGVGHPAHIPNFMQWTFQRCGWKGQQFFVLAALGPRNIWPRRLHNPNLLGRPLDSVFRLFCTPIPAEFECEADPLVAAGLIRPYEPVVICRFDATNPAGSATLMNAIEVHLAHLLEAITSVAQASAQTAHSLDQQWERIRA